MRLLLVLIIVLAVVALVAMRVVAARRRSAVAQDADRDDTLSFTGHTPLPDPKQTTEMADPPPGSRGYRGRHDQP